MPTDNGQVTYLDAISQALMSEMDADPDVFIIGEDVGQFGGAFKVTKGFLDKYGPRRVVDTPMAESGFTGLAAGASLVGLRPVIEYQFADFISAAFDQIINVMARHHFRTGDPMPVTMRAPFGESTKAPRSATIVTCFSGFRLSLIKSPVTSPRSLRLRT